MQSSTNSFPLQNERQQYLYGVAPFSILHLCLWTRALQAQAQTLRSKRRGETMMEPRILRVAMVPTWGPSDRWVSGLLAELGMLVVLRGIGDQGCCVPRTEVQPFREWAYGQCGHRAGAPAITLPTNKAYQINLAHPGQWALQAANPERSLW